MHQLVPVTCCTTGTLEEVTVRLKGNHVDLAESIRNRSRQIPVESEIQELQI